MIEDFWKLVDSAKNVLIVSHKNPDGDTLGSALALYNELKREGKSLFLYNFTKELPKIYDFLPGIEKIKNEVPNRFDLVIACDCADFGRLGIEKGDYKLINIDHHQSNTNFGDINIIDDTKSSVGEMVFEMLTYKKSKLSKESAICIYTSIAEDSGFFRYPRVNQKTFEIISLLVGFGVEPNYIANMLKGRESLAKKRLIGYIYSGFELLFDAQIAYYYISRDIFKKSGARVDETKNIAASLLDVANVKVSVLILRKSDLSIKVSIRSETKVDISSIALDFGGGGHPNACGFELPKEMDIDKVKSEILDKIMKLLKESNNE